VSPEEKVAGSLTMRTSNKDIFGLGGKKTTQCTKKTPKQTKKTSLSLMMVRTAK